MKTTLKDKRTLVIGDVHGCYNTLIKLLDKVQYDKTKDKIIFIGDYIDRGNYSYEVLKFLTELQDEVGTDNCICIRGNHEQMYLDYLNSQSQSDLRIWSYNGCRKTIRSFTSNAASVFTYKRWLDSLPFYIETEHFLFVHAGAPFSPLNDNDEHDFIWNRDWIYFKYCEYHDKITIFGHTPSKEDYFKVFEHYCIDTACVYGNKLCCLVIEENETDDKNFKFIYENTDGKDISEC